MREYLIDTPHGVESIEFGTLLRWYETGLMNIKKESNKYFYFDISGSNISISKLNWEHFLTEVRNTKIKRILE
jgi:hypothetical protein